MNRAKKPLNNAIAKAIRKEVREGQRMEQTNQQLMEQTEVRTQENMLAKYPKKLAAKNKNANALDAAQKQLKLKARKRKAKISKRTTPGKVDTHNLAPESTNKEGGRWLQTIQKQTLLQAKSLVKKLFKRKSYR
jgi:hypothetical protein